MWSHSNSSWLDVAQCEVDTQTRAQPELPRDGCVAGPDIGPKPSGPGLAPSAADTRPKGVGAKRGAKPQAARSTATGSGKSALESKGGRRATQGVEAGGKLQVQRVSPAACDPVAAADVGESPSNLRLTRSRRGSNDFFDAVSAHGLRHPSSS